MSVSFYLSCSDLLSFLNLQVSAFPNPWKAPTCFLFKYSASAPPFPLSHCNSSQTYFSFFILSSLCLNIHSLLSSLNSSLILSSASSTLLFCSSVSLFQYMFMYVCLFLHNICLLEYIF